ncbi:MOSC domain-containing protein [Halovulum dunhuangense]|uniref:MOSC domain-containing protein n=1 Tax=Halovulum dunhuangense TaxID=1505036 RepID=A0A849L4W3_9RHOB|nr:MOSC domain-containing protein [Halovulum dunhuangense]NNU81224.1 MOSC domain-containing protein [Halovulum dunhuangense]
MDSLADLMARVAQPGLLVWIGLRPARREPMVAVPRAEITAGGLAGDRTTRPGPRAVTLIQAEHLPVIAALSANPRVHYAQMRRNLAVSGLNLAAMRGRCLSLGTVVLRVTGPCAPCSRMEEALGPGGYTAMRGHGGVTAEVVTPGLVRVGDRVVALPGTDA